MAGLNRKVGHLSDQDQNSDPCSCPVSADSSLSIALDRDYLLDALAVFR